MVPPDAKPRVVLVHGAHDSAASFEPIRALLPDLDVVTYTRRGWDPDVNEAPPPFEIHVQDLLDVLDEEPSTVVGHSWGGNVAMAAAVRRPDLVLSLGVYETALLWLPGWPPEHANHLDPAIERAQRELDEAPERAGKRANFLAEARASHEQQVDVDQIRVPTVVGTGGKTLWTFGTGMDVLAERIAAAEIFEIPDATHMAHREHPEEFARFVRLAVSYATRPAPRRR